MNDELFNQRAHANPHDDSPDFLDAMTASPGREALVAELRAFDTSLKAGLETVSAPEGLKQTLLDIPEGILHPDTAVAAANDSFWRRNMQYAAGLIVAIGVLALVLQNDTKPMETMVFSHIYSELPFLEDDTPITLEEANQFMSDYVGKVFEDSEEMANVTINFSKDCWVDFDKGIRGVHLVMKGNSGPLTVMVIPNTPVERETSIADERFNGVITPTPGGNLVVVGEKDEAVEQFSTLLAGNINW
jgi:hypothetical protein